ncbi:hypothetical protein EC9_12390 [Rosistilla ulvae]|uniref:Carboxypeptidase regulatory-like domain-containing protein n=1 Tax=Rosistilla ulvae TaxID=1930277 RepID=A0A517LWR2_9BACT|nr:hypothetical protein [Rosistilla ulvae]QDS87063.1 hypothetical protein EC9_12390 [Rosistilla ulvae]
MFLRLIVCSLLVSATVTILPGCGSQGGIQRASVEGNVTVDGEPVDVGSITFVPTGETKGPATGGKIVDGEYAIESSGGPVPGEYLVQITGRRGTGKFKKQELEGEIVETEVTEEMIPEKYRSGSELKRTIEAGENSMNLELTNE